MNIINSRNSSSFKALMLSGLCELKDMGWDMKSNLFTDQEKKNHCCKFLIYMLVCESIHLSVCKSGFEVVCFSIKLVSLL